MLHSSRVCTEELRRVNGLVGVSEVGHEEGAGRHCGNGLSTDLR